MKLNGVEYPHATVYNGFRDVKRQMTAVAVGYFLKKGAHYGQHCYLSFKLRVVCADGEG